MKLTPTSILNESAAYTVTVSGATDAAGIPMAAPYSYSFTTGASPTCPCTIFTPAATPAVAAAGDAKAVELGVKFKVDRGGYVTGVRFYKGSTNTGVHVGSLWSSTGTLLARATFAAETASGWQQVNFAPHVPGERGRHLRRLVPHQRRALFVHGERVGLGGRHPADARARHRRSGRRQRRVPIRRRERVPDDHRERDQLLRRRGVRHGADGDRPFTVPRRDERRHLGDDHRAVQ